MIFLPRPQDGGGEVGLVGRVGEVLRFQTEAAAFGVHLPAFAGEGIGHHIAGVELDARLASGDIQTATAGRFSHGNDLTQTLPVAV